MSVTTILIFIVIAVVEVVASRKKAEQKKRMQKQDLPRHKGNGSDSEGDVPVSDTLRELLEKYAEAHPEDADAGRYANPSKPLEREVTPEQLADEAYEEWVEQERVQALMDYRRERLYKFKKDVGISEENLAELQKKCLNPEVSDDEFENILKAAETELCKKRLATEALLPKRKLVPDDCEMQKGLQAKAARFSANPLRAKMPELGEERLVRRPVAETVEKTVHKPKFRMTAAEARRGVVLAKILEEPRFKKRWSSLSR